MVWRLSVTASAPQLWDLVKMMMLTSKDSSRPGTTIPAPLLEEETEGRGAPLVKFTVKKEVIQVNTLR